MAHVRHLGFELELKVVKIVSALLIVPEENRDVIVQQLQPAGLRRVVAEQLGLETS